MGSLIINQKVLSNHLYIRIEILRMLVVFAIQYFKLNTLCLFINLPSTRNTCSELRGRISIVLRNLILIRDQPSDSNCVYLKSRKVRMRVSHGSSSIRY